MTTCADLLVIMFDVASIGVLLFKIFVRRSGAGLSYDMFVCITVSGVLFLAPNMDILIEDIGPSVLMMVAYAAAVLVSFPAYLRMVAKEPLLGPMARPLFCRWYVIVPFSLCVAVVLGDHHPDYSSDMLPLTPGLLAPLYLDAFSRVPQLWLVAYEEKKDALAYAFFAFLISSRLVECFNWVYFHCFHHPLLLFPVMFQAVIGADYLYFWMRDMIRLLEKRHFTAMSLEV